MRTSSTVILSLKTSCWKRQFKEEEKISNAITVCLPFWPLTYIVWNHLSSRSSTLAQLVKKPTKCTLISNHDSIGHQRYFLGWITLLLLICGLLAASPLNSSLACPCSLAHQSTINWQGSSTHWGKGYAWSGVRNCIDSVVSLGYHRNIWWNRAETHDDTLTTQKTKTGMIVIHSNQGNSIPPNKIRTKSKARDTLLPLSWIHSSWIILGRERRWPMLQSISVRVRILDDSGLLTTTLEMSNRALLLDFLKSILCFDPDQRFTPQEALMHPFIAQHVQPTPTAAVSPSLSRTSSRTSVDPNDPPSLTPL